MLSLKKPAPSLKRGKGVAKAASAVSHGGTIPMKDAAARLGFKRGGKPAKPKFEFQEILKKGATDEEMRRRGLMKAASTRVYNQMGLSIRSHEVARAALLWFNQFRETVVDENERAIGDRLAIRLGDVVEEFFRIRTDKIALADELEHALTSTKQDMRLEKLKKAADEETAQRKKGDNSLLPEESQPGISEPSVPVDPDLILRSVVDEIKLAESAKRATKKTKKKAIADDDEKETS
jgi:hypothetical protein